MRKGLASTGRLLLTVLRRGPWIACLPVGRSQMPMVGCPPQGLTLRPCATPGAFCSAPSVSAVPHNTSKFDAPHHEDLVCSRLHPAYAVWCMHCILLIGTFTPNICVEKLRSVVKAGYQIAYVDGGTTKKAPEQHCRGGSLTQFDRLPTFQAQQWFSRQLGLADVCIQLVHHSLQQLFNSSADAAMCRG